MDIRQILFPVDFSSRSIAAAQYVSAMAALFGSKVTLVHAVEDPLKWYGSTDPIKVIEVDVPAALRESQERLSSFAAAHLPNMEVVTAVELRNPLELIESVAKSISADLIMMPTRGGGRFRSILGSVTAKVLHDLTSPVWTDVHEETSEFHWPVKTVACAIDLGPGSADVLRFGADFTSRCGATMFVIHGVPVAEMRLGAYSKIELPSYMVDFARAEIEKLQIDAGTSAEVHIESGPIAEAVRNSALQNDADLVVMGRGAISHAGGYLTAHAYSMIREAPCPVLSL